MPSSPDVVPFCIYSMSTIVHLLGSHLLEEKPVLTLAEETGIPYQVIYSFLSLLSTYLSKITLLLRFLSLWEASSSPTLKQTLARITAYTPARFMVDYFNHDQLPLFLKRKDTSSYPLRFSGSG